MCATDLRAVLAMTMCAAWGCATTTAPSGFLPDTREAQTSAYGSWIDFTYRGDTAVERLQGELIAVSMDSVWVLAAAGGRAVPVSDIVEGRLAEWNDRHGQVAGATVLGVVSTISNGAFLILTAPIWIIGGTAAAAGQSRLPLTPVSSSTVSELARFARFPPGMPPGIAVVDLQPKPAAR